MLALQIFLPLLFLFFSSSHALYGYGVIRCQFTSTSDLVYLEQIYFNKILLGQYNSTLGKYVGYTEKAMEIADELNKSERFLEEEKKNQKKCREHIQILLNYLSSPVEPSVRVKSIEIPGSKENMLLCSVYSFYPKHIKVTWLRDGKEVTTGVTSTEELSNGNWLYQVHSYLEFAHIPGETIACKVDHASFREPKTYNWEPMPEAERTKIAIGTSGLLLGLVVFLAGLIAYKRSTNGRMLVPAS